jgi:hypothetical protein
MFTWGSLFIAAVGIGLNAWGKDGRDADADTGRAVARAIGMLLAVAFTSLAFFFAVTS